MGALQHQRDRHQRSPVLSYHNVYNAVPTVGVFCQSCFVLGLSKKLSLLLAFDVSVYLLLLIYLA